MVVLHFFSLLLLGLLFGSFGSVIFFRLGDVPSRTTLKGFLFGRSHCRHCHHTLDTRDLIPLWSFFSQQGKCRYCHTKLSRWYPILELGTVAIFVSVRMVLGMGDVFEWYRQALLPTIGLRLLFLILLYDLKAYELHLTASLLFLLLSFFGQWGMGYNLRPALQGMIIFFLVFLCIYYGAKRYVTWRFHQKAEGFGFGDVILAGILGSVFPVGVPLTSALQRGYLVVSYLVISCLLGLLFFGIQRVLITGGCFSSQQAKINIPIASSGKVLPFLPAMIVAFVGMMLFGQEILSFLVHYSL